MTPTDAARHVRSIVLDAMVVQARAIRAIAHIDQSRGGYPATASGATTNGGGDRTIHVDGDTIPVTATEARVIAFPDDPAGDAYRRVCNDLPRLAADMAAMAKLVTAWTPEDSLPNRWSNAAEQLEEIDQIWCPNHLRFGEHEPRADKRVLCRWCDDIKRTTGSAPDEQLIRLRKVRHRITTTDYEQFRRRAAGKKKRKTA